MTGTDQMNAAVDRFREALHAVPSSREKSLAVTKLEEAQMWAWRALDDAEVKHASTSTSSVMEIVASAVLLRDGDNCRFCDCRTREPREGHERPDDAGLFRVSDRESDDAADWVNACRRCVREYGVGESSRGLLRPAPAHPFWSKPTADFITETHPNAVVQPSEVAPSEQRISPQRVTTLSQQMAKAIDTSPLGNTRP